MKDDVRRFARVQTADGRDTERLSPFCAACRDVDAKAFGGLLQHNSGGPLPHSIDLWKAGAPELDFLSPDIYFNEFAVWAGSHARPDNPLFIPETEGAATGSANALYAFGQLKAIGFSPFGIDGGANSGISNTYAGLARLVPLILQKQSEGGISAMVVGSDQQRGGGRLRTGDYIANLAPARGFRSGPPGAAAAAPASRISALFMQTGPNESLVVGSGDGQLTFTTDTPGPPLVGTASIDELFVQEDGSFAPGRRLNGDESGHGLQGPFRAHR